MVGSQAAARPGLGTRVAQWWRHGDTLFQIVVTLVGLSVVLLAFMIGYELWVNSALSRAAFGWGFVTSSRWDPALDKQFGALPFIQGTLVTSFLALLIAGPIGIGVGIFLSELSPGYMRGPLGTLVELLAAVPSVVYGLWGLFAFVPHVVKPASTFLNGHFGLLPLFAGPVTGASRLAAGMILAIMVLPYVSALSRDVLRAIPNAQREGAMALGATRWETISQVLLPYSSSGLLAAVMLGLARALGETIAVTMVIGNNLDRSWSLLHPGYTMASIIANEFAEATYDLYVHALIEVGLILFAITLIINAIAQLMIWRLSRGESFVNV